MYQDSKGTLLHIEDVVKLHDDREAIIMTKEEDGTIWVNPINAGEPLQVTPSTTTLVFSLFGKLNELKTDVELMELLSNVEKYAQSNPKKVSKPKAQKEAVVESPKETLDISF